MSRFLLKVVDQMPGEGKISPPSKDKPTNDLTTTQGTLPTQGSETGTGTSSTQGTLSAEGRTEAPDTISAQGTLPTPGTRTAQRRSATQGSSIAPGSKSAQARKIIVSRDVSPQRDYMKAANSIVRLALSTGVFRGKSKQLYDYLYSKTRGAIVPKVSVQLSRADIMKGAHIGSTHTLRDNLKHLRAVGLLKWEEKPGQQDGNEYFVYLPEEVFDLSPGQVNSLGQPGQNVPRPPSAETTLPAQSISPEESETSGDPKTFIKTGDDATHTLTEFIKIIERGAKEVCGGELSHTEQERKRWNELAELLVSELKTAAGRADTVSSAPAFLAAQLKRKFARDEKKQGTKLTQRDEAHNRGDSRKKEGDTKPAENASGTEKDIGGKSSKSNFTFEERRRYAQSQQPPLGNGWMVESISGKYDELIDEWLKTQANNMAPHQIPDTSSCPDCHGTGMYYPEGYDKGAAKCRHQRLRID